MRHVAKVLQTAERVEKVKYYANLSTNNQKKKNVLGLWIHLISDRVLQNIQVFMPTWEEHFFSPSITYLGRAMETDQSG